MIKKYSYYLSFHEAVRGLSDSDRLAMYDAMGDYAFEDKEPSFSNPLLSMAWTLIKPHIQASKEGQVNAAKRKNNTPKDPPNTPPSDTPLQGGVNIPPSDHNKVKESMVDNIKLSTNTPTVDGAGGKNPAPPTNKATADMQKIREEQAALEANAVPCTIDYKAIFDEVDKAVV